MLLITYNVWFGPSKNRINRGEGDKQRVEEKHESFATLLSLGNAIRRVQRYEKAFNERYAEGSAVNFTLLTVTEIPHLTPAELEIARVSLIESLAQRADKVGG